MKPFYLALGAGVLALGAAAYAQSGGPAMGHDPFGSATITRAEAQAKAVAMFDRMDANHDGKLDQTDRTARLAEHFARMDTNHDGVLSRDEFMAAHSGPMARDGAARPDGAEHRMGGMHHRMKGMAMRMMGRMDANGDRVVTRDEFVAGALKRFDAADANHDGKLTPEERRAAMRAHWGQMHHDGMNGGQHTDDGAPPPAGH